MLHLSIFGLEFEKSIAIFEICLLTTIPSVYLKKITEDILHKIYTEKGAIISIWLVLSILEVKSLQIQVSWQPAS